MFGVWEMCWGRGNVGVARKCRERCGDKVREMCWGGKRWVEVKKRWGEV